MRTNPMAALTGMLLAGVCVAPASGADEDHPLIRIAVARAKCEIAFSAVAPAANNQVNGWDVAWTTLSAARRKIDMLIGGTINDEQRKDDTARDKGLIEELGRKRGELEARWNRWDVEALRPMQAKRGANLQLAASLPYIFNSLKQMEDQFKNAGMNLDLLLPVYAALEARVKEVTSELQHDVSILKNALNEWETIETGVETLLKK